MPQNGNTDVVNGKQIYRQKLGIKKKIEIVYNKQSGVPFNLFIE